MDIIIAPHADDEIIGCFEILNSSKDLLLLFHPEALEEGLRVWNDGKVKVDTLDNLSMYLSSGHQFYFPDHTTERHPLHRMIGAQGEAIWREFDEKVYYYTTNMNVPYLRELAIEKQILKLNLLNKYYSLKKSLWEFEHQYFLFEGRIQWIK